MAKTATAAKSSAAGKKTKKKAVSEFDKQVQIVVRLTKAVKTAQEKLRIATAHLKTIPQK